ncbi:hypothetical protein [Pseudobutyrivibrio sp.]|uniref:hypothetical protein n=1 Tax=Pseudobutyrivibrio sp. TaxID=2014367 RepID=UPI001DFA05AD|nr:hypothetical protein [Pseudobutyrivibrio sp.]MBE5911829.1 hypothetical protein [Pseudobutyrivibrio sp.]
MNFQIRKTIYWGFVICVLVTILLGCGNNESVQQEFSVEKWQKASNEDRYLMIEDLQEKYELLGMTDDQIKELLGEQSLTYDPDKDGDNGNYYLGYDIRYDEFEGDEVLLIKFEDYKVIAVEKEYLSNL